MEITVEVPLESIRCDCIFSQQKLEELKKENPLKAKDWIESSLKETSYDVVISLK